MAERNSQDQLQELKEAVCDAVLERTRRVVAGEAEHGQTLLGDKPSRILATGFLLPQLNADGDDETSDIRISAHGLDVRLRVDGVGTIEIRPRFSVYVRALPSADELFARNGRLVPIADFSPEARKTLAAKIRARLAVQPQSEGQNTRAAREAAARASMIEMGVGIPEQAVLEGFVDPDEPHPEVAPQEVQLRPRLRIPTSISRTYQVPQKWVRVEVDSPLLQLSLPIPPNGWVETSAAHALVLREAAKAACLQWVQSNEGKRWAWRAGNVPSEAFWSAEAWDKFLATLRNSEPDIARLVPDRDLRVLVDPLRDVLSPQIASVRIALENLREMDEEFESAIFGVRLEVRIPDSALLPMKMERVKRSYHLAGFLTMPAVGVNGGVEDRGTDSEQRVLRTTWMPRFVLPRMQAATIPDLPTSYAALMDPSLDLAVLHSLTQRMTEWIGDVERNTSRSWPGEDDRSEDSVAQEGHFRDDLEAWRRECARLSKAIRLLERAQLASRRSPDSPDAIPYRAWLLTNAAFSAANPTSSDSPNPGWRLFQLAFVLAHVPTLASRVPGYEAEFDASFDEDSASLLYMSTGGGKTEAFFGTIVFALFLDRLRGKHRGVTVMMHYPLRLLTIQQAQRLARLLAHAELIRRGAGVAGAAFEIGFWVGSANTPNQTESGGKVVQELRGVPTNRELNIAREHEANGKAYLAARDAWNKLPKCPFCGAATGLRLYPEQHHRLAIVCSGGADCSWGALHQREEAAEPLPFLLTDADIYRRAPSVLLGTVDKLALIGQNTYTINRIAGMFGLARWVEGDENGLLDSPTRGLDALPEHARRVAPSWRQGANLFYDPFPSLIVQDEMHLLDESLGTFGGIFETGLVAWFERLAPLLGSAVCTVPGAPDKARMPHVIGATATAADVGKHVSTLYQKHVVQFPHPGPSLLGGFYVRLAEFEAASEAFVARTQPTRAALVHPRQRESAAPWARVYASLLTNGRLHTVTTLVVLAVHAATITRWVRDLTSSDRERASRAASEMASSLSDNVWLERRRAALSQVAQISDFRLLANLVDLHRIELTYVTNKKGGDQILAAINAEVMDAHDAMGPEYALSGFKMELISGGVDVKGIQSVVADAQRPFDVANDDISDALRGIVATSAISHGVDVESFNAMAFAGMPSDVAEYIQASSRVGRRHVGFSLLLPTPQARRDRFVVGVHEMFHRLLERMIAPPAIQRWADRAIKRTIPSLVQTWLAGVYYQKALVEAPDGAKEAVSFPATVDAVNNVFTGIRGPQNCDDCLAFVQDAVGISANVGGAGRSTDYYRDVLRLALRDIRTELASGEFGGRLVDFWNNEQNPLRQMRPMTSLRDVDEPGIIVGSRLGIHSQRITAEELSAAMVLLRNRGVGRNRLASQSEMDGEE